GCFALGAGFDFDSILTTAGRTFLTTSRNDVGSTTVLVWAVADCPWISGAATKPPTSPPTVRLTRAKSHRTIGIVPPICTQRCRWGWRPGCPSGRLATCPPRRDDFLSLYHTQGEAGMIAAREDRVKAECGVDNPAGRCYRGERASPELAML